MKERLDKWFWKNWLWLVVGCLLQEKAIEMAYQHRGMFVIGGEWFVGLLVYLVVETIRSVIQSVKVILDYEDDES